MLPQSWMRTIVKNIILCCRFPLISRLGPNHEKLPGSQKYVNKGVSMYMLHIHYDFNMDYLTASSHIVSSCTSLSRHVSTLPSLLFLSTDLLPFVSISLFNHTSLTSITCLLASWCLLCPFYSTLSSFCLSLTLWPLLFPHNLPKLVE